jgi:hypothetical protein
MAFKTFAPGVLTSSDVNTFLMRQAVIVATSSTRPASPNEGMTIYETDTDRYKSYSGSAWEDVLTTATWRTFTPGIRSFGAGTDWALGNATTIGYYTKIGRLVIANLQITWGSTSTFGTKSLLLENVAGLDPHASGFDSGRVTIGTGQMYDDSTGNGYPCLLSQATGSGVALSAFSTSLSWTTLELATSTVPFTWAAGDVIGAQLIYQAAS